MTDEDIFKHYINVAEILGEMFGPILEVIVHDLRRPEHSIIAIINGHITGRTVGDGTSDLGVLRLKGEVPDKIVSYANQSPTGEKLKSSTLAIRNSKGDLLGSFSLNLQTSYFDQFGKFIEQFISTQSNTYTPPKEQFYLFTPREEIKSACQQFLVENGLLGKPLNKARKKEVILFLHNEGHLNKRGVVTIISEELGVSRNTIYRYLKEIETQIQTKGQNHDSNR
ncbi:MAG: HTH domain-containing protein [Desulfobacteraceae bacterium]|nr:HTH domain-containing protein [Desulfobacteraceae bacterium]